MASSFAARLRRGHLIPRLRARALREVQSALTTLVLSTTRARPGHAAIVTLNADEENATVQAVLLGDRDKLSTVVLLSPSPEITRMAVNLAAARLNRAIPIGLRYEQLSYPALLRAYRRSTETYSTHVLLPGRDLSRKRRHVHLTHGSGPKPDTTFRGPANVLASITPHWVAAQLKEYKLGPETEVITYMPRLEVMRRASHDPSVSERLGFGAGAPFVVWAPTYRLVQRKSELRQSGTLLSELRDGVPAEVLAAAKARDAALVIKAHPHEADSYANLGLPVLTNASLREAGVTPYEVFGAAALVITDYSSVYVERAHLGFEYLLVRPDEKSFASSYRGFRNAQSLPENSTP